MLFSDAIVLRTDHKFKKWDGKSKPYFGLDLRSIHGQNIDGTGIRIAIIDGMGKKNSVQHKAIDNDRIIKRVMVEGDYDYDNHALVCTSIAVGQAFDDGLHIKPSRGDTADKLSYPGGVAPGAEATVFLVNLNNRKSIIAALDEVVAGDYHVLSMSLVCSKNLGYIAERLEKLEGKTIIVAAAGNSGNNCPVAYPARLPYVISVGSLSDYLKTSGFSPENSLVNTYYCGEVFAPCIDVTGCMLKISTGTSMATPGIAGLVCLFMQCAIKHGYGKQMGKKENMMKLLQKVIEKYDTPNLEYIIKAYKKKKTFDKILGHDYDD